MSCPLLSKNNLWPSMHRSEVLNRTRYHEVVPQNTKKPLSPEFMQAKDQRFASNFQWLWPELKQFNAHRTLLKALKNKSLFTAKKKIKDDVFHSPHQMPHQFKREKKWKSSRFQWADEKESFPTCPGRNTRIIKFHIFSGIFPGPSCLKLG